MSTVFPSMNENKKPPVKPTPPIPPRRSILSQGSLPGRTERSHFIASQSVVSPDMELSFLQDLDESRGDDDSNLQFIRQADNTLLSLVTRRLYDVEAKLADYKQHVHDLRQEITVKNGKIQLLMQKLRTKEKILDGVAACPGANSTKVTLDKTEYQGLQDKCTNLKKTVQEMNRFFSDYGVTWVGDSSCQRNKSPVKFTVDFRRLLASIDELNLFVREGESQLVYTNQGATFKMPESVPLTLFSNGLMLFSGPFRDYEDPATREFVKDILDGFFPSELQRSYPDGVPFKVIDKHETSYQDPKSRLKVFGGTGQRLGRISSGTQPASVDRHTHRRSEVVKYTCTESKLGGVGAKGKEPLSDTPACPDSTRDKRGGLGAKAKEPPHDTSTAGPGSRSKDSCPDAFTCVDPNKDKRGGLAAKPKDPEAKRLPVSPTLDAMRDGDKPQQRGNSKGEGEGGAVPVRKSSAATNIASPEANAAADRGRTVKDSSTTITFGESLARGVYPVSRATVIKRPNAGPADRRQIEPNGKSLDRLFASTSTVTPETVGGLHPHRPHRPRHETIAVPKRTEDFLRKLPPVVVRDGKLVDIRGAVADIVQTPKPTGPSYHTIKFDDNHPRIQLKIRSVDGERIYLVYISPHRTIGDLRVGLDEMTRINGCQPTKYTIINASNPSQVNGFSNHTLTLQQLGIVHNTVLFLQNSSSPRDGVLQKTILPLKK